MKIKFAGKFIALAAALCLISSTAARLPDFSMNASAETYGSRIVVDLNAGDGRKA